MKAKFLVSPSLRANYYSAGKYMSVFQVHAVALLFAFLLSVYPEFLIAVDAAIVLWSILFRWIGRWAIMNGNIPAYYSKDYDRGMVYSLFFKFAPYVYLGAYIRLAAVFLYYGLSLLLSLDDATVFRRYANDLLWNLTDAEGFLIGTVLFLLKMYVLYYHHRYIPVREFSFRSMSLAKRSNMPLEHAMSRVLMEWKAELATKAFENVKCDEKCQAYTQNRQYETRSSSPHQEPHKDEVSQQELQRREQVYTLMRRQARE